jgi:hypothetical protein
VLVRLLPNIAIRFLSDFFCDPADLNQAKKTQSTATRHAIINVKEMKA